MREKGGGVQRQKVGEKNLIFCCYIFCASNQILSRGQLVESIRKQRKGKQTILSSTFAVTKYMLPSFRIVAYYHVGTTEVVSDSVWVEVQTSCMGTVRHTHLHQHRLSTREQTHRQTYILPLLSSPLLLSYS